ncbi:MAG: iron-sulfur cluster assembly accessory protein [Gammaproteobacteria bacterium]|nr:iron-sulfur cluster assembly accessory protein [Gammaproteobacteria bacterium]
MSEVMQHVPSKTPPMALTKAAQKHVLSYLAKKPDSKGIRFSVKKTGCSGLSYVIDYIDAPHSDDITLPLGEDYMMCLDKKSYPFLKGTEVDYVKQGLNYQFVFRNPNQTGQCGCGESFTVN